MSCGWITKRWWKCYLSWLLWWLCIYIYYIYIYVKTHQIVQFKYMWFNVHQLYNFNVAVKMEGRGLPWWRGGWESACQCRGHGFVPRSGKIPHAAERLGPWATTTEPACLEPVLRNGGGCDSERPAHRDEEWPPLAATGESPCMETRTQHSQK